MKKPYTFYKLAFGVAVLGFSAIASPDYSSGCMNWLAVVAQAVERVQEKGA
jgi:hypothetical protein